MIRIHFITNCFCKINIQLVNAMVYFAAIVVVVYSGSSDTAFGTE